MDDYQWRTGVNPGALLSFKGPRAGERRLLLFTCACARRCAEVLDDSCARRVLEILEDYADGRPGGAYLLTLTYPPVPAQLVRLGPGGQMLEWLLSCMADRVRTAGLNPVRSPWPRALQTAREAARRAEEVAAQGVAWGAPRRLAQRKERLALIALAHDLFGNPFRRVGIDPAWRSWAGGLVAAMARAIYDERRFEDVPILADALEEAGCTERTILEHARRREHARGCWVLDLIRSVD